MLHRHCPRMRISFYVKAQWTGVDLPYKRRKQCWILCRECRYGTLCEHRGFHIHHLSTVNMSFVFWQHIVFMCFIWLPILTAKCPWTAITSSNSGGDAAFPLFRNWIFRRHCDEVQALNIDLHNIALALSSFINLSAFFFSIFQELHSSYFPNNLHLGPYWREIVSSLILSGLLRLIKNSPVSSSMCVCVCVCVCVCSHIFRCLRVLYLAAFHNFAERKHI